MVANRNRFWGVNELFTIPDGGTGAGIGDTGFDSNKANLHHAPVPALPDENKSFSVVWDASVYAIGCAL
ncbi:Pol protein [Phytophthora palmivora]|uniref:Pol protein n=1 Tax=Phytophthora palmivora TaxID=4796 RepID=A0A2P4X8N0_9STRA|nr:Pol protein [Phytophthora palmivora]